MLFLFHDQGLISGESFVAVWFVQALKSGFAVRLVHSI